jgi:hypothetical protein
LFKTKDLTNSGLYSVIDELTRVINEYPIRFISFLNEKKNQK